MQPVFKIGDKAVYPAQGVTEITGIESKEIMGNQEIFYVLRVLDTDRKIMIPVGKVDQVGLREVISSDRVDEIYQVLRERAIKVDQTTWNRRYRRYLEKIKTGAILDVAEVLRDLYLLKVEKPLSFGERKMLDTARQLLVTELSVARGMDDGLVLAEIREMFGDEDEHHEPVDDDV
ncbi:MAG: RNA polymerase-binding transcription factor CarD [Myxococcales bacterium]